MSLDEKCVQWFVTKHVHENGKPITVEDAKFFVAGLSWDEKEFMLYLYETLPTKEQVNV